MFDIDSIGLTNLLRRLNQGLDPGGNPIGEPTRFVVGVALNQGADLEQELERFAWKVEAGADFAVTQPVFDAEQLERFLGAGPDPAIPVIAGIWPLTSLRNAEFLANEVPGVHVPPGRASSGCGGPRSRAPPRPGPRVWPSQRRWSRRSRVWCKECR